MVGGDEKGVGRSAQTRTESSIVACDQRWRKAPCRRLASNKDACRLIYFFHHRRRHMDDDDEHMEPFTHQSQ